MPGIEDGDWSEEEFRQAESDIPAAPTGPGPSSKTPDHPTEPHPAAEEQAPEEFDPKFRVEFEGLLYIGRLSKTFSWMGHVFAIRTLTVGEMLEIALLTREYAGTFGDAKAYQAAVIAGCVVNVDGRPLPAPITSEPGQSVLLTRFQHVITYWFAPVLDVIYEQYLLLEKRVEEVIEQMGKVSGSTDATPTLSATSA